MVKKGIEDENKDDDCPDSERHSEAELVSPPKVFH